MHNAECEMIAFFCNFAFCTLYFAFTREENCHGIG